MHKEIRAKILAENHTDRPHNKKQFGVDVEHEITESTALPCTTPSLLISSTQRPRWAKRRYYLLATLFGLSPLIRSKLDRESDETEFHLSKLITEISK